MKGIFTLYIQIPISKNLGQGTLSVEGNGVARFTSSHRENSLFDSHILAVLHGVRLELAAKDGIRLSGFQPNGVDKQGREKFRYQEWWLAYA